MTIIGEIQEFQAWFTIYQDGMTVSMRYPIPDMSYPSSRFTITFSKQNGWASIGFKRSRFRQRHSFKRITLKVFLPQPIDFLYSFGHCLNTILVAPNVSVKLIFKKPIKEGKDERE